MANTDKKELGRVKRHKRLRRRLIGTDKRPRLSINRSVNNLYIQLIDDMKGNTLLSLSTRDKSLRDKIKSGGNLKAAAILGEEFAVLAKAKGYEKVVFDRGGYLFHGRIKAIADAARAKGLVF